MEKDEFAFDLGAPLVRISDEEMLRGMRELAVKLGRRATMRHWMEWSGRPCSATSVFLRFGGWGRAQQRAGMDVPERGEYTSADLMDRLEKAWRKLGRPPGSAMLRRLTGVTLTPYKDRWGSVRQACERLSAYKRGRITREEMLKAGRRLRSRKEIGSAVRYKVFARDGDRCALCGHTAADGRKLEVDHIVPVSKGGGNEEENLRVLCDRCNRGKGARAEA